MAIKAPWTEKYRPTTLDGFIFQDEAQRAFVTQLLASKELPNLMLYGIQGSGKTTLARIIIDNLQIDEADLLEVDASRNNSVEFIRTTIIPFAESYPLGALKVVHLEEFDYMSPSAQATLRVIMEDAVNTCRFICTCNFANKIIPPLKSRMQTVAFKAPIEDDVIVRMVEILDQEKVEFDPDTLFSYVKQAYPDIRKIINNVQQASSTGKLEQPGSTQGVADWRFSLLDKLKACDIRGLQELVAREVGQDQLEEVYEFLYRNLSLIPSVKADKAVADQAVIVIADSLRAHAVSSLPHVTLQACLIKLMQAVG